jgi:exodeoxyribonuclease VII small subunit
LSDQPTTFEEALGRLEKIVSDLESGKHSLEDALRMFEEGIALGRQCREFLDKADMRVRTLVDPGDGSLAEGGPFGENGDGPSER